MQHCTLIWIEIESRRGSFSYITFSEIVSSTGDMTSKVRVKRRVLNHEKDSVHVLDVLHEGQPTKHE